MLQKIDGKILAFWDTYPNERAYAYMATFVPLLGLISGLVGLN